ncbi:MAG TPA: oligosaccharide flippase family protein, partial [Baekduia sp.]
MTDVATASPELAAKPRDSALKLLSDTIGARLLLAVFSMVNIVLVTRVVGPSVYGIYASATAYAMLLGTLTDLGSASVVVREGILSGDKAKSSRTYLQVRALLILGTVALGAAIVPVAFPAEAWGAAFAALGLLVFSGATIIGPLGQLHGSMRTFRRGATIQGVATMLATIAVVVLWDEPTPLALVLANVAGALVGSLYAVVAARHWTGSQLADADWTAVRKMLSAITLLGFGAVISAAYARVDGVLLLNLGGAHDAGIYQAAYRFLDQSALIPAAAIVPVTPMIVAQLRDHARVSRVVDDVLLKVALVGGIAVSWLTIGSAHWLAVLLLGPQFSETGDICAVLAVYRAWSVLAVFSTSKTIHSRQERRYIAIAVVGLIVNVGVNLALIPRYGAMGAAVATLVTEFATVTAFAMAAQRVSDGRQLRTLALTAFAGALAAAITLGVPKVAPEATQPARALVVLVGFAALAMTYRLLRTDVERVRP